MALQADNRPCTLRSRQYVDADEGTCHASRYIVATSATPRVANASRYHVDWHRHFACRHVRRVVIALPLKIARSAGVTTEDDRYSGYREQRKYGRAKMAVRLR